MTQCTTQQLKDQGCFEQIKTNTKTSKTFLKPVDCFFCWKRFLHKNLATDANANSCDSLNCDYPKRHLQLNATTCPHVQNILTTRLDNSGSRFDSDGNTRKRQTMNECQINSNGKFQLDRFFGTLFNLKVPRFQDKIRIFQDYGN